LIDLRIQQRKRSQERQALGENSNFLNVKEMIK
jgi:hypothetical protein